MSESDLSGSERSLIERLNIFPSLRLGKGNELGDQPGHRGGVIALCVLCSLLLWIFSSMSEVYTKIVEVDTSVKNLSPSEAFLTLPPNKIQLHVKGEGLSLIKFHYNPPNITIDATDSEINLIDVVSRNLSAPVEVERVIPPFFTFQKEERIFKKVPILLNVDVTTPPTYELVQEPITFPDSVMISGAISLVDQINEWPTVELSPVNVKDTLNLQVELIDSLEGLIDLDIQTTQLLLVSEEFTEGGRDIEVLINQDYVTLDPPIVEVTYRVPLSQYPLATEARDFFLSVSIDDIRDDTTGFVTPVLELPEGILFRDVHLEPEKLRYYDVLLDE